VKKANGVRQVQIHTAETLATDPSASEFKMLFQS
jgi:hypothetical protein